MNDFDLLRRMASMDKQIQELRKSVHGKTELAASRITEPRSDLGCEPINCISADIFDRYEVVMIYHQPTNQLLPIVKKYLYSEAITKYHRVGIAMTISLAAGDSVKVQVAGLAHVRVEAYAGTYAAISTNNARAGQYLRGSITTAGRAQFLLHEDNHTKHFMAMQDQSPDDKILLVKILPALESYVGPFKGIIASGQTQITIGYDRAYVASATQWVYDHNDSIAFTDMQAVLNKTVAESVTIMADNTFVFYRIVVTAGPTITATLMANITDPYLIPLTSGVQHRIVVLGKAKFNSAFGGVYAWTQYHYGQIVLSLPDLDSDGLFAVNVTQVGGSAGNSTSQCSFTYDVYSLGDAITAIVSAQTPIWNRPATGKLVAATSGTAYINASGAIMLYQVDEVNAMKVCS